MKGKLRRILAFFSTVLMLLGCMPFPAFADEEEEFEIPRVYHKDSDNSSLRLVIGKTETVTIGKTETIPFTLMNTSEEDWKKVHVRIAPEEYYRDYYEDVGVVDSTEDDEDSEILTSANITYPFEIVDSLNEYHSVGSIRAGAKRTVNLKVSVRKNLPEGYYPVLLQVTTVTESEKQNDYEKTMIVWAKVKSATDKDEPEEPEKPDESKREPIAFVIGENQPTPQGVYNEVMNFHVNLRNSGYKTAYDVRVEMELSEDVKVFPFEINDGNYDRWPGKIEPNQTVEIPYSMAIQKDAESGYYPIKYKIRYRTEDKGDFGEPIEDVMYVRIIGDDKEKDDELSADAGENERTKARIIVESYETEPERILAGEAFTLRVRMKNASSQIEASNILFTFEPESVNESPVFTTVNGSNSVVVGRLAPGASEELTIQYNSSPSAEQRSYTVTITEQYDSPEYKNAKENVKIAVPLWQEPRLNTGTIEVMPNAIDVGSESNIMLEINNTGKVMLYNVTAVFEADSIERSETYVGNIKPGESGSVDAMIYGIAPTMDDGKIRLTILFEDEGGTVSSVEKDVQLYVSEPMPMDDFYMDMDAEMMEPVAAEPTLMERLKPYSIPIAAGVGALVGVITYFIRKKKKKAGMEDEIF